MANGSTIRRRISPAHPTVNRISRHRPRAPRTAILICQALGPGDRVSLACPTRRSRQRRRLSSANERRTISETGPRSIVSPAGQSRCSAGGASSRCLRSSRSPTRISRTTSFSWTAVSSKPNPERTWMGYSVGRWEGDTLVVDSFGFNDRTWLDGRGLPHTEALRTTERYVRRNFGQLQVELTVTDPGAFANPWTMTYTLEFQADTEMIESVCEERSRWIGRLSDVEQSAVTVSPKRWRNTWAYIAGCGSRGREPFGFSSKAERSTPTDCSARRSALFLIPRPPSAGPTASRSTSIRTEIQPRSW